MLNAGERQCLRKERHEYEARKDRDVTSDRHENAEGWIDARSDSMLGIAKDESG
jgi:hypothetical protein